MILLAGCGYLDREVVEDTGLADTAAAEDSGDSGGLDSIEPMDPTCPDAVAFAPEPDRPARTLAGRVTWTLDFDETAEAGGYHDCDYTREFTEFPEDNTHGWLCPECDWMTTGEAVMTEGYDDCYLQIDDEEAVHQEHLGLATVDGVPHFFRGGKPWLRLADMGALEEDGAVTWSDEATFDEGGGGFLLSATGTFSVGESETVVVTDIRSPRTEDYACGDWPRCNPGGDNASFVLATGEIFPNVRLRDQCDEAVDLWDFWGRWLIIDSSSPDCGPCQVMADAAEPWREEMASKGYAVELITLLNASLGSINRPADLDARADWADDFEITSPVLGDEGFGYATMPTYLGKESGMSFPSILVIGPDMRLRGGTSGFGAESGFAEVEAIIAGG